MDEEKEYQIYNLRSKGKSIRAIAKEVGISVGRTHKACSSMSL
jgi:DNA-binding CsgD family transcriptional regulator